MPEKIKLETINLQVMENGMSTQEVKLTFGTYNGEHTFVAMDEDSKWDVNNTQECTDETVCKATAGEDLSWEIKPKTMTGWLAGEI